MRIPRNLSILALLAFWLTGIAGCVPSGSVALLEPSELGLVVEKRSEHGTYYQYAPVSIRSPWRVAVLVHGTPPVDATGRSDARALANRWRAEAEARGVLLIAPAFDERNFGSLEIAAGGGYRSLVGRVTGADDYLHEILDGYRSLLPTYDGRIHLYGFSAGGQFVARYCVRHPERVRRAVIAAANTYPWPDPAVSWPNGMRSATIVTDWGEGPRQWVFDVGPGDFIAAGQIPMTVVVGTADTEPLAGALGNIGSNRMERGRNWVEAMNRFTAENRRAGRLVFRSVPGAPHNSEPLTPASMGALF